MIEFTERDREMIEENNRMLKAIIAYINNKESNDDIKNFIINVAANAMIGR